MRDTRPVRKTFPVNALVEGRRVLVVGGGRVGQRKVELSLDAGADVALVCPVCVEELAAHAREGRIRHAARPFEPGDVAGVSLVFACTDDRRVNRRILDAAREARVPCCCADGNWCDGDFVTPAIVRSGDVLIAVSTSGKSCRQSRLIKDNLRRHLDSIEGADLLVLGTSHLCLDAVERAPFHLLAQERETVGGMIRQVWGVHEFFILNTCNRIEVVAAVSREAGASGILHRLLRFDALRPDLYYMKHGFAAFAHLCRVSAGMDSQTPGEFHVVSQVKDAADEAAARGWAGPVIRELCDTVLHVSKDVRRAVEPLLSRVEIEDVALNYLEDALRGLAGKTVAVVGTGRVGRGVADGLRARGGRCLWVYHRNRPEAGGADAPELLAWDRLETEALPQADAVVCAVDVQEPVLRAGAHGVRLKPGAVLVDLGMPHNIEPALDGCAGARVADLDCLKLWQRTQDGSLEQAQAACEAVVDAHRDSYERIRASIQGN
ncbi:MAG: hypothetical protein LBW77_07465 [Verrucomicrobiota bacterium]|jgi:precorrin-2 dehydrogenase/sirohydrochlorin ferrochelatase|nr:hypothetical protein [Verrucomicrobiota bacterium]